MLKPSQISAEQPLATDRSKDVDARLVTGSTPRAHWPWQEPEPEQEHAEPPEAEELEPETESDEDDTDEEDLPASPLSTGHGDGPRVSRVPLGPLADSHVLCSLEDGLELVPVRGYDSVLVLLHGIGDTMHGWLPYALRRAEKMPRIKVVLLQAPERRVTALLGFRKTAWFDLASLQAAEAAEDPCLGLDAAQARVVSVVERERAFGLPPSRVALLGFSQGAAVVLWAALQLPDTLAAVVSLHGWMPRPHDFQGPTAGSARTPVLMCHGEVDQLVPVGGADTTYLLLKNCGFSRVQYIRYEGVGHEFRKVEGRDVRRFLLACLASAPGAWDFEPVAGTVGFGAQRRPRKHALEGPRGCDPFSCVQQ